VGERFGKYQILSLLGRGGMAVVYRVRDPALDREVALKLMSIGSDQDLLDRFRQEAQSMAALTHPNIVTVFDHGDVDDTPYLVMELVEGGTLAGLIEAESVSPREAMALMAEIVEAAAYAHDHGIIHRDLKPGNILLDQQQRPRVMDFGLARRIALDHGITVTGQILGTPAYMAPEQARGDGKRIDARADVFALGVVMYELLTFDRPFGGETVFDVLRQVQELDPIPPRELNHRVHIDAETICLKALEKTPARRYQSASKMARDIRDYLAGEPILARPPSLGQKVWRKLLRHRRLLLLVCLMLAVLLPALYWSLIYNPGKAQRAIDAQWAQIDGVWAESRGLYQAGKIVQAIEKAEEVIRRAEGAGARSRGLDPSKEVRKFLADAHHRLADEGPAKSRAWHLAQAYHHDSESSRGSKTLFLVGQHFAGRRQDNRARVFFRKLMGREGDPWRAPAALALSRLLLRRGELARAWNLLEDLKASRLPDKLARERAELQRWVAWLGPPTQLPLGYHGQIRSKQLLVADIDGDGGNELLSINPQSELVILRLAPKSRTFKLVLSQRLSNAKETRSIRLAVGELDGRPPKELVVGYGDPYQALTRIEVWRFHEGRMVNVTKSWGNTLNARFGREQRGSVIWRLAVRDVTGDGRADIVCGQGWYQYHSGVFVQSADGKRFRFAPFKHPGTDPVDARWFDVAPAPDGGPPLIAVGQQIQRGQKLFVYRYEPGARQFRIVSSADAPEGQALILRPTAAGHWPVLIGFGQPSNSQARLRKFRIDVPQMKPVGQSLELARPRPGGTLRIASVRTGKQTHLLVRIPRGPLSKGDGRWLEASLALVAVEPTRLQPILQFYSSGEIGGVGDLDGDGDDELIVTWQGAVQVLGLKGTFEREQLLQARRGEETVQGQAAIDLRVARDLLDMDQPDLARKRLRELTSKYPDRLEAGLAQLAMARSFLASEQQENALRQLESVCLNWPQLSSQALYLAYRTHLARGAWVAASRMANRLGASLDLPPSQIAELKSAREELEAFGQRANILIGKLNPELRGFPASSPYLLQRLEPGVWRYRGGPGYPHSAGLELYYHGGSFALSVELKFDKLSWDAKFAFGLFRDDRWWTRFNPQLILLLHKLQDESYFISKQMSLRTYEKFVHQMIRRPLHPDRWYRLELTYIGVSRQAWMRLFERDSGKPIAGMRCDLEHDLARGPYTLGVMRCRALSRPEGPNRIRLKRLRLMAGPGVFSARPSSTEASDVLRQAHGLRGIGKPAGALALYDSIVRQGGDGLDLQLSRCGALLALKRKADAAVALQRALKIDRDATFLLIGVGSRFERDGLRTLLVEQEAATSALKGNLVQVQSALRQAIKEKRGMRRRLDVLVHLRLLEQIGVPRYLSVMRNYRKWAYSGLGLFGLKRVIADKQIAERPRDFELELDQLKDFKEDREYRRAYRLARKLLVSQPRNVELLSQLTGICCAMGRPREVLDCLERLVAIDKALAEPSKPVASAARRYIALLEQELVRNRALAKVWRERGR